jgi:hypothetical protein
MPGKRNPDRDERVKIPLDPETVLTHHPGAASISSASRGPAAGTPGRSPGKIPCPRGDLNTRSREISPIEEIMRSA